MSYNLLVASVVAAVHETIDEQEEKKSQFKPQWGTACGGFGGDEFKKVGGIDGQKFRIDAIRLCGGIYVDSIDIRVNGKWQGKHGGNGGWVVTLELAKGEYISSVNIRSWKFVDQLTIFTNYSNSISRGSGGGTSYSEIGSNEAMLLDMRGRSGTYLDQIQFYWGPAVKVPYNPKWRPPLGGSGGSKWGPLKTNGTSSTITGVRLYGGKWVDSIEFQVDHKWTGKHGGGALFGGGDGQTLILDENGEYFSDVVVRSGKIIDNVKFTTNKQKTIQTGGSGGVEHTEGGAKAKKRLIDCRGRSGWYLDAIQFMWMDDAAFTYSITSCTFDVDQGTVLSQTPEAIATLPIENKTDTEQQTEFEVNETKSNESSFNHEHGFTVKVGTSFSAGIPLVEQKTISIDASTAHTWKYGETNTTEQQWTGKFTVKCPPHKSIVAQAIITKAVMNVPYTITVKNGLGDTKKSTGVWKGVSTYNLALKVENES
eukprot:260793_1